MLSSLYLNLKILPTLSAGDCSTSNQVRVRKISWPIGGRIASEKNSPENKTADTLFEAVILGKNAKKKQLNAYQDLA
jgi:hypothetical protein